MSSNYDHYFWQLRELQQSLAQLEPQLRLIESIPRSVREQIEQLSEIRDRFTLPSEYLNEVARVQAALEFQSGIEQLRALHHLDSPCIHELARRQEEIGELMRQINAPREDLDFLGRRILESLASVEVLLESHRIGRDLAEVAVRPQLAFQEFARHQLELTATSTDIAKENRLDLVDLAADLLDEINSGLELGFLMTEAPSELELLPAVNIYSQLSRAVEGEDLGRVGVDVERIVTESSPANVASLGAKIVHLVYNINVEAEREGREPVFKPTTKVIFACAVIPALVATNERSFSEIVDGLYFLLYEGSGSAKRLLDLTSDDELRVLWSLKHLRLGARHDVDHGLEADVAKKNRQVGEAYKSLIGMVAPRTAADWTQAQVALYGQLVEMLETIWYGEGSEEGGSSADKLEIVAPRREPTPAGKNPYPLRGVSIRYDDPTEPVAEDDWDVLQ